MNFPTATELEEVVFSCSYFNSVLRFELQRIKTRQKKGKKSDSDTRAEGGAEGGGGGGERRASFNKQEGIKSEDDTRQGGKQRSMQEASKELYWTGRNKQVRERKEREKSKYIQLQTRK